MSENLNLGKKDGLDLTIGQCREWLVLGVSAAFWDEGSVSGESAWARVPGPPHGWPLCLCFHPRHICAFFKEKTASL